MVIFGLSTNAVLDLALMVAVLRISGMKRANVGAGRKDPNHLACHFEMNGFKVQCPKPESDLHTHSKPKIGATLAQWRRWPRSIYRWVAGEMWAL